MAKNMQLFHDICHRNSDHREGDASQHALGQTPPRQTPPWANPLGGHCSGRYASYWNAFLSYHVLSNCNPANFNCRICIFISNASKIYVKRERTSKCIFLMSSRLLFRFDFRPKSSTHIKWHLLNFNILVLICTENLKCIVWNLDDLIFQVKI